MEDSFSFDPQFWSISHFFLILYNQLMLRENQFHLQKQNIQFNETLINRMKSLKKLMEFDIRKPINFSQIFLVTLPSIAAGPEKDRIRWEPKQSQLQLYKMNLYCPQKISNSLFQSSQLADSHCEFRLEPLKIVQTNREGQINSFMQNLIDQAQSICASSSQGSSQKDQNEKREEKKQTVQAKVKQKKSSTESVKLSQSLNNNYYNNSSAREYSPLIRNTAREQQTATPGAKPKIAQAPMDFTQETINLNLINKIKIGTLIQTPQGQVYLCSNCKLKLSREHFEESDCKQVNSKKFCIDCLVKKVETQIERNKPPKCFCQKNILPNSLLLQSLKTSSQEQFINILKKYVPDKSYLMSDAGLNNGPEDGKVAFQQKAGQYSKKQKNLIKEVNSASLNRKKDDRMKTWEKSQQKLLQQIGEQCPGCKLQRYQCIKSSPKKKNCQQNELVAKKKQKSNLLDQIRECCCCSIF